MSDLEDLRKVLEPYDRVDTLATIGALQLLPQNASHLYRLNAIAACALTLGPLDESEGRRMSASRIRRVMNGAPLASARRLAMEDPFEDVWTESVAFFGGDFLVLSGLEIGGAQTLRALNETIFLTDVAWPHLFLAQCEAMIAGTLAISAEMCRRAGVERHLAAEGTPGGDVAVPPASRLAALKNAVTFTAGEVADLARPAGLRGLSDVVGVWQQSTVSMDMLSHLSLSRPMVTVAETTIVLMPVGIVYALRNAIIRKAQEHLCSDLLAREYRRTVAIEAKRSMERLAKGGPSYPLPGSRLPILDRVMPIDRAQAVHLIVLTDDLRDYDADEPDPTWQPHHIPRNLTRRVRAVRRMVRQRSDRPDGSILHLMVFEALGRSSMVGFEDEGIDDNSLWLPLTSRELSVLSRLGDFDLVDLWKYARDRERLRATTHVQAFAELDVFQIYWGHGRTFYISDDRMPDALGVMPGTGVDLIVNDARRFDRHTVPSWLPHSFVEVMRRYPGSSFPIYITDPATGQPAFLVEGYPCPVWIVPDDEPGIPESTGWIFREGLAYWMWQCQGVAQRLLDRAPPLERFVLRMSLADAAVDPAQALARHAGWARVETTGDGCRVRLGLGTGAAIGGSTNESERHMLRLVLEELASKRGGQSPFDVEAAVDAAAPFGRKKMWLSFAISENPDLAQDVPTKPRFISAADRSLELDRLGVWLSARIARGPIPREQRVDVLNQVVEYYFQELIRRVAELTPEGLLEYLMRNNEALLRNETDSRLMIPTRIACFGGESDVVKELAEQVPSQARAAIANRFLIEYIAAQPPSGDHRIDAATYDGLVALTSEISDKGYLSDAIHFELTDVALTMFPSGRLGVGGADQLQGALEAYRPIQAQEALAGAETMFGRAWREAETHTPEFVGELDPAFVAEFGISLSETAAMLGAIWNLGVDQVGEPKGMAESELVADLGRVLGWPEAKVRRSVAQLTLSPRELFFPADVPKSELYPWRFGRSLSYLRRPLVLEAARAEHQVLWGSRNVLRSGQYLLEQCLTGRLNAVSVKMKRVISRLRQEDAEAFNDKVAELVTRSVTIVDRRVRRVGELRIARENGDDLGDIDVLVLNRELRLITALETKDVEFARTPVELASEVAKLAHGDHSASHKHDERLAWIRGHVPEILRRYGVEGDSRRWRVKGFIVTSRDLLTPLAIRASIETVSYRRVRDAPESFS